MFILQYRYEPIAKVAVKRIATGNQQFSCRKHRPVKIHLKTICKILYRLYVRRCSEFCISIHRRIQAQPVSGTAVLRRPKRFPSRIFNRDVRRHISHLPLETDGVSVPVIVSFAVAAVDDAAVYARHIQPGGALGTPARWILYVGMIPNLHVGHALIGGEDDFLCIVRRKVHRCNGQIFLTIFNFQSIGAEVAGVIFLWIILANHIVVPPQQIAPHRNGNFCTAGKGGGCLVYNVVFADNLTIFILREIVIKPGFFFRRSATCGIGSPIGKGIPAF